MKKHEAISADILARKERFMDLKAMSASLRGDNYHAHALIGEREEQIMTRWQQLLDLLKLHKDKLERYCTVIGLQREIDTLSLAISTLHTDFSSTDNGIHLLDVQEKLHKFQLQESQVKLKDLLAVRIESVWVCPGPCNVRDHQEGGEGSEGPAGQQGPAGGAGRGDPEEAR